MTARDTQHSAASHESAETDLQIGLRLTVERIYGPAPAQEPGLDFGRSYRGAAHDFPYGGDLIDRFHIGTAHTSIVVVDIAGHGIDAAMNASLIKYALRAFASLGLDALQCVVALNHFCIVNSVFEREGDFFATLFFGAVDRERATLRYVSAGHDAACHLSADVVTPLEPTGPVIGLLDDQGIYESRTIALAPGDVIAIVTDGFTESRDANNTFLGREALSDVLRSKRNLGAQAAAEAITEHAYEFSGRKLRDDVAAFVLQIPRV